LQLLDEIGFLSGATRFLDGTWNVGGLSWQAHDFVDAVRDEQIWQRTKEGALNAGGWTLELLTDLAKGFLKQKIEKMTGIEV
jgi:hypothetical protein